LGAQKTISSYSFDRIVLIFGYIVESTNTKILSRHFVAISILNPNYDVIMTLHSCTVIATQQPAVAGRQNSEISARQQAPAQLTPPMGGVSLKLFYDGTTREIK